MSLAPIIVAEIFEIIRSLNRDEGVSLLVAGKAAISLCAMPISVTCSKTGVLLPQVRRKTFA